MRRSRKARYESCVMKLKSSQGINPYAVCHASVFKTKTYKGYKIEQRNGVIEVVNQSGDRFIPSLDDSKLSGYRTYVASANNVKTAKKYIDWVTK